MIEVASLLGMSYTGKSTLASTLLPRLADEGIIADVIKKDDAVRAFGRERYGEDDATGGYSITGFLRRGQVPQHELHAWMNRQVRSSLELGHIAILEGGTRTRTAQAETLADIELDPEGLRIYMLELPLPEMLRRARQRRKETNRYDDRLPVALAKLYGQYRGINSADAPRAEDLDVSVLDASLPTVEIAEIVANEIFESHVTE